MNRVIYEFVKCGNNEQSGTFFDGDQKAFEISTRMSRNAKRKFLKYEIVPSCFFTYLKVAKIIREEPRIPEGGTKLGDLLDFLRWYPYETDQARSAGEYLFREIIKGDVPFLSKAFALGDHVWEKGELFRVSGSKAS